MTASLVASLRQVADDLTAIGSEWALIGGFAVSARAEPRFTSDLDCCVAVAGDAEAEALASSMISRGYRVASLIEHEYLDRLATVRLVSPLSNVVVIDLLFASSGIEREIVEGADELELVPGLVVPVAQVAHLVVLKLLSRDDATRPQDLMDLRSLRAVVGEADAIEVRRLSKVVTTRGFNRGRNLESLAETFLAEP